MFQNIFHANDGYFHLFHIIIGFVITRAPSFFLVLVLGQRKRETEREGEGGRETERAERRDALFVRCEMGVVHGVTIVGLCLCVTIGVEILLWVWMYKTRNFEAMKTAVEKAKKKGTDGRSSRPVSCPLARARAQITRVRTCGDDALYIYDTCIGHIQLVRHGS